MPRTLLFDLDGTLVDSVPDLLASANRVLAAMGLPGLDAPTLTAMVGDGAAALVARMLAAHGRQATPDDVGRFVADYTAHVADRTRPYPAVSDTLDRLAAAGWRLGVVTNKPEAPARLVLQRLGLLDRFAVVAGGDTYPVRKPDPDHVRLALQAMGGAPDRAVMVGDHHNDLAAAAGAGLPSIFAAWGYGTPTSAASATAASMTEVPALAERLLPA